jgi:hypothetical protein
LVRFLPRSKRPKKTPKKTEGVHSSHKLTSPPPSAVSGVKSSVPEDALQQEADLSSQGSNHKFLSAEFEAKQENEGVRIEVRASK